MKRRSFLIALPAVLPAALAAKPAADSEYSYRLCEINTAIARSLETAREAAALQTNAALRQIQIVIEIDQQQASASGPEHQG